MQYEHVPCKGPHSLSTRPRCLQSITLLKQVTCSTRNTLELSCSHSCCTTQQVNTPSVQGPFCATCTVPASFVSPRTERQGNSSTSCSRLACPVALHGCLGHTQHCPQHELHSLFEPLSCMAAAGGCSPDCCLVGHSTKSLSTQQVPGCLRSICRT